MRIISFDIKECPIYIDRAGSNSCVNNVIEGCTCVNKRMHFTWMTIGIRGHFESIYTRPTGKTGSLTEVSLQSGVLALDMVSHEDWSPGVRWRNGPLVEKQKKQKCKTL